MAKVLVIDDSEDMRSLFALMLERVGHTVSLAPHGGIGLTRVMEESPDIVLLDMMMPEVDGLEFLSALRDANLERRPAVLVVSGFETYRDEARRRGATAFLSKPISPSVLCAAVDQVLRASALEPHLLALNRTEVAEAHRVGLARSRAIAERLELARSTPLMASLRALVDWLPRYFGFGTALVQTLHGKNLRIEACGGELEHTFADGRVQRIHEGAEGPREWTYCDELLQAGSTVVLPNPRKHPCVGFAEHYAGCTLDWQFYLGVPIVVGDEAIAVLCLAERRPHTIRAEDVRLFEVLGRRLGTAFAALACGDMNPTMPTDARAIFGPELLGELLDVSLKRAWRHGRVGALLSLPSDPTLVARVRQTFPLGSAIVEGGDGELRVLVSGEDARKLQAKIASALSTARRVVPWPPAPKGEDLTAFDATSVCRDLITRLEHAQAQPFARGTAAED